MLAGAASWNEYVYQYYLLLNLEVEKLSFPIAQAKLRLNSISYQLRNSITEIIVHADRLVTLLLSGK